MKTEDLIQAIAADPALRTPPVHRAIVLALAASLPVALVLFFIILGPRSDFASAMETIRFPLKFVLTASLAASALALVARLSVPGAEASRRTPWLLIAPLILILAVGVELFVTPMSGWPARWLGNNWLVCLSCIPLLSAAPLLGLLAALRAGAPARPGIAGAVAGLAAGGLGATLYAAHCPDDSPLFVATWYVIAIIAVSLVGAAIGSRMLRW